MKKVIMPLISSICLGIVLLLLIIKMYSWYVTNDKANVSGASGTSDTFSGFDIVFNNNMSANVLPGEITEVEIDINSIDANATKLRFSCEDGWKDLDFTKATSYDSNEVYYSLSNNQYTLASGVDNTNYSEYYVANNIINKIYNDSTDKTKYVEQMLSLDKLYKIDEYYNVTNNAKGDFKYLNDKEKKEVFLNLYKNGTYSISSKIKMYLTETQIDKTDYAEYIDEIEEGTSTKFKSITQTQGTFNLSLKDGSQNEYNKKVYCYLYFDKTNEIFKYTGSNTNLSNSCFFGQNPYYYQVFNINIYSSPN